ncbi:MAG: amidohydrolase family protein [Acidimicrobiia bacterium]|nr:amidohydrolase family protein [Acidimicrobiia bacterium]
MTGPSGRERAGTPSGRERASTASGRDVVLRGGTVLDAAGERRADVLVGPDGRIAAVGLGLDATVVLDAGGCLVAPGLVDLFAQLGQPGLEDAETIAEASRAAALGGFTAVVARPDTDPPIDGAAVVREVLSLAEGACCEVRPAAALTVGMSGEQLTPMAELAALGVRLFVDEGRGAQDARVLRRALEYAVDLGVVVGEQPEEAALARGGCAHEGEWASRLGLPGIPAEAEELAVMRALALARLTGGALHLRRLSTASSIAMAAAARAGGVAVTVSTTAQHGLLTDAALQGYDPAFRFGPPLRPEADRAAVADALAEGRVDVLVSDHSPQPPEAKELPFDAAAPGAVGLQTVLGLALGPLGLEPARALEALSWRPAEIAGLEGAHGGLLQVGRPANLVVLDPEARWRHDPAAGASRSRNTPFGGWELRGRVRHTLLWGEPVVVEGAARR